MGQIGCSAVRQEELEKQKAAGAQMGSVSMAGQYGGSFFRRKTEAVSTTTTPYTQIEVSNIK